MTRVMVNKKRSRSEVNGQGHRGQNPTQPFSDGNSSLNSQMMIFYSILKRMTHKAWCYRFSSSSVKFQGHTANGSKIVDFDPNWAFPDCNSSFDSTMAKK